LRVCSLSLLADVDNVLFSHNNGRCIVSEADSGDTAGDLGLERVVGDGDTAGVDGGMANRRVRRYQHQKHASEYK
jgi:hypothetical protein